MWRVFLLVAIAAFIGDGRTLAGTFVEFPNLPGREPVHLIGYLARPDAGLSALMSTTKEDAAAPYPAVVMLHGCGGTSSHSATIADRFGAWGYVALAIDTFGSRGRKSDCGTGSLDQVSDAYAALRYLSTLEVVDAERVALFGQSMGGSAVLYAIDPDQAARYSGQSFRAAIAYYPACGVVAAPVMTAPLLILIGEADEWNSADACERLRNRARPNSASIDVTIYSGVHHAFYVEQLKPGRRSTGRWVEYDELATRDAEDKTRVFLAEHLARMPATTQPRPP